MAVPTVIYLLKAPNPGQVKTRLAVDVGDEEACAIYCALAERQYRALPPGWPMEIHFAPPEAEDQIRLWLPGANLYAPQSDGDLGDRLAAASAATFKRGTCCAFFIGADCPDLNLEDFAEALRLLSQDHDAVFGPARDGGYYLLAVNRHAPELFSGIPWSTDRVLEHSLEIARKAGLKTALLEEKEDIDDLASLRRCLPTASPVP